MALLGIYSRSNHEVNDAVHESRNIQQNVIAEHSRTVHNSRVRSAEIRQELHTRIDTEQLKSDTDRMKQALSELVRKVK